MRTANELATKMHEAEVAQYNKHLADAEIFAAARVEEWFNNLLTNTLYVSVPEHLYVVMVKDAFENAGFKVKIDDSRLRKLIVTFDKIK